MSLKDSNESGFSVGLQKMQVILLLFGTASLFYKVSKNKQVIVSYWNHWFVLQGYKK
jgi:hypothetical protein